MTGFVKTPPSEAAAAAERSREEWGAKAPPLGAEVEPATTPEKEKGRAMVTVHVRLARAEHEELQRIAEHDLSTLQRHVRMLIRTHIQARKAG